VVPDAHTERQRITKSPSAKINSKIAYFEEFSWQRSPSKSPTKSIKNIEQDVNSTKSNVSKSDRKSTKIISNESKSHHPVTPNRTKVPALLKPNQDEVLGNSSSQRKSMKSITQKPRRALVGSFHGTRYPDKAEALGNDVTATESSVALPISTDVQPIELKNVKPTRQKINHDPMKEKQTSQENRTRSKTTTRKKHDLKSDKDKREYVESDAESASSRQSLKKSILLRNDSSVVENCEKPMIMRRQSSASNMNDLLKLQNLMSSKPHLKRAGSDGTLNCSFVATHEPAPNHDWFKKQHETLLNSHNDKISHEPESNNGLDIVTGKDASVSADLKKIRMTNDFFSVDMFLATRLDEKFPTRKLKQSGSEPASIASEYNVQGWRTGQHKVLKSKINPKL
jgi:hypothetical protein